VAADLATIMTLTLSLLGRPQIVLDGADVTARLGDKPLAVVAYLALETPPPVARDKLAAVFWRDKSPEAARYRLRNTLWNLRRDLGQAYIGSDDVNCWLNDAQPVQVDALALQAGTKAARSSALPARQPHDLLALADLYRGEFLAGIVVRAAPQFDEWLLVERERLQLMYEDVLWYAAQAQQAAGRYGEAGATLQRLIQADPLRERSYRALMNAYAANGDRATALRVYDQCARTLLAELSVGPSAETRRLRDQLARDTPVSWQAEIEHRLVQAEIALAEGRSEYARTLIQAARKALQSLSN
jgi:DNA-binding SARP family transcriptional activator